MCFLLALAAHAQGSLEYLSVKDPVYGAKGDGVTDDAAAIQKAIMDAVTLNRGTVLFPAGQYVCAKPLVVPQGSQGLTLLGVGSATSGSGLSSSIRYSGTGTASFLVAGRTSGLNIRNLAISYSSPDFQGILVDLDCPVYAAETVLATIENCFVGGGILRSATALVSLSRSSRVGIYRSNLSGGLVGIRGRAAADEHSNVVRVVDSRLGDLGVAIKNAGEDWVVSGNSFEPSPVGSAAGYDQDAGVCASNVNFFGNWFGDVTASGTWIRFCGNNLTVVGNGIYGSSSTTAIQIAGSASSGISIHGNNFGLHSVAIDVGSGNSGFSVQGNNFDATVATPIRGSLEGAEAIVAGNTPRTPSVIKVGGNVTSGGTVRGTAIAASGAVSGRSLFAVADSGSISATGSDTAVVQAIRPAAGKHGWLTFEEDGVASRWTAGIHAGDANLYFGTGSPGAATPRVVFGESGVGVGGAVPSVSLDAAGAIATRATPIALSPGANPTVPAENRTYLRVTAPRDAFAISGLTGGVDGQILVIYNGSGGEMTLKDEDLSARPQARVRTLTGVDVHLAAPSSATLIYDSGESRWILLSSNAAARKSPAVVSR